MSRIEIEITKENNGLKIGHKATIDVVYAMRMVEKGFAKYVKSDDKKSIENLQNGLSGKPKKEKATEETETTEKTEVVNEKPVVKAKKVVKKTTNKK